MDNLTTTISPLVIDLIFLVFILLIAAIKAKAGLYDSVVSVVIIFVALAIGLVASKMLTQPVADYYWQSYGPKVEAKFDKQVEQAQSGETSIAETFADAWNQIIKNFDSEKLNEFQIKVKEQDFSDAEIVQKLRALTLLKSKLVVENVVHLALFGVITAIALLALTLIKNVIGKVADFSVIGWVNHLGGFALGAIEAIVILIVIIRGAGLLHIDFFQNLSEGTVLLKWLIGGDVQSAISGIQSLTIEDLKNIKLEDLTTVDLRDVGSQVKELLKSVKLPANTEIPKL